MSYSLNSLQGIIQGVMWGIIITVIKGVTKSLDFRLQGGLYRVI